MVRHSGVSSTWLSWLHSRGRTVYVHVGNLRFCWRKWLQKQVQECPNRNPTILMAERFGSCEGFRDIFPSRLLRQKHWCMTAWRENKHQILVRQTISLHFIGFKDTNCFGKTPKFWQTPKLRMFFQSGTLNTNFGSTKLELLRMSHNGRLSASTSRICKNLDMILTQDFYDSMLSSCVCSRQDRRVTGYSPDSHRCSGQAEKQLREAIVAFGSSVCGHFWNCGLEEGLCLKWRGCCCGGCCCCCGGGGGGCCCCWWWWWWLLLLLWWWWWCSHFEHVCSETSPSMNSKALLFWWCLR